MDDRTYIPGLGAEVSGIQPGLPLPVSNCVTDGPFELAVSAEEFDQLTWSVPNPVFIPVPKRTVTAEDRRAKEKAVEKRRDKSKAARRARARNRR